MGNRRRTRKRNKNKGPIAKLWGYCKCAIVLSMLGCIGYGVWYSKQDEATQERAQQQALVAIDWLIERDETNREADAVLRWVAELVPVSDGVVVSVGEVEGADRHTFAGLPIGGRQIKLLQNEGYIVGYDEVLKNPAWVAYRINSAPEARTIERPSGFNVDRRTRAKVKHADYTNTGFDRGHMAPNYAIGRAHGANAQIETFLMSNIVPQLPDLNRGPWKTLEQLIANDYLEEASELWVLTGPIYDAAASKLPSGVVIPVSFFKIVIDVVDSEMIRVLAFNLPQAIEDGKELNDYLTSIDRLESQTGLDFLSLLEDDTEALLEAQSVSRIW